MKVDGMPPVRPRRRHAAGWLAAALGCAAIMLGLLVVPTCAFAVDGRTDGASADESSLPDFRPVGSSEPFRAEIITEVMLDRTGFMWIGTREGLFLYDGQHFQRFQHRVQDPQSISSNGIRGLLEDNEGRLWINTISGGLNLLDRASWTFRTWRHDRNDPHSISHDGVFALAEAADGKLWVGTQAGLDLFDPETGRFEHQVLATGGEFVIALELDDEGRLWVGTLGQGLFRQSADMASFNAIPGGRRTPPLDIFSLQADNQGGMWVGARNGLFHVPAGQGRIIPAHFELPTGVEKLSTVTALQASPDGGLWIGTFGVGLFWRAAGSDRLQLVKLGHPGSGAWQIDGGALALERNGDLIVGTFGAGLLRASPPIAGLRVWQSGHGAPEGLKYQDVYALSLNPAHDGQSPGLLVGSFGGGMDEISLASGKVQHRPLPVSEATQRKISGITDLIRSQDGTFWAATNEGVYRWNPGTGAFRYFDPQTTGTGARPGYSYALFQDRHGRVWVGSAGGGLYLYQPNRDGFRNFRPRAHSPTSLSDDFVTDVIEDRQGRLWVGTRSGGISVCTLDENLHCRRIDAGSGPGQISHDHVTSLLQGPNGDIWVGTAGGGLNRLHLGKDGWVVSVRRWTLNDGLADNNVMALVQAPDGALWMSTHGGLTRLDPNSGELLNVTPRDGLPTAIFNPKAALAWGEMLYFGSAKGVVAIDYRQRLRHGPAPPTVVKSITGPDGSSLVAKPAWLLASLDVAWRKPFSLQFAVLGYAGGQAQFQYRLGPNQSWVELGDQGLLTLHALAPGSYRLEVRGRRGGKDWTQTDPLDLRIVPPWWRRTGVQIAAGSLVLLLLFAGFYWRVRELQSRNRALQQAHDLRRQALEEAHQNRDRLAHAFAMLRRMTMKLDAAKEDERRHIARELHDEFGQALTGAKINLGLVLAGRTPGMDTDRVRDTINLIETLIGQVRALSLSLRPPLLDEMGLMPALEAYMDGVSERSGLNVRTRLDSRVHLPGNDRDITVFRVVQEAVTNALRHAEATQLTVSVEASADGVRIRVADNGRGFDPDALQAGSGMGLFGMRERVHDLGGEWFVRSRVGQGTEVEAFVPVAGS